MFLRRLSIERVAESGEASPCPVKHIDSFSMRNFTNDAVFDDTLPAGDGLLEAGIRVPLELLRERMEQWFRRKGYLTARETLRVHELPPASTGGRTMENLCTHDATSFEPPAREPR